MSHLQIAPGPRVALGPQQVGGDVAKEGVPLRATHQAPVKLTPMREVTDVGNQVAQKEEKSGSSFVRFARKAKDAVPAILKNQLAAKAVGVDATKVGFLRKVLRAGAALPGLVAAGLAGAATNGASLIAAAVMTGVVFLISGADARCAYMNHKNAVARANGEQHLPHAELPMGDSSVGNLLHKLFTAFGMNPERAKTLAAVGDKSIRVGMQVATAICTMGMSAVPDSFVHIAPVIGGALNIARSVSGLKSDSSEDTDSTDAIDDGCAAMREAAKTLPEEECVELLETIKDVEHESKAENERAKNSAVSSKDSSDPRKRAGALATLAPETATAAVNAVGTSGYGMLRQPEIRA